MKNALIISGVFHASLLVMAAMDIPWFDSYEDSEMVIIPVEVLPFDDKTQTMEIAKLPEPQREKPKPPERRPERVAELPPPPPRMQSTMPLPTPPQADKPKPKPKPEVRAEAPRVTPRSRPRPPSRLNSDRIAALLNKVPEQENVLDSLADRFGPQEQQASSLDVQRQTMQIKDAFKIKMRDNKCWNLPAGSLEAAKLQVKVRFRLSREGEILGQPRVEDYSNMTGALRSAADSARRAVFICAPYDDLKLPAELYDEWKEIILNFDPSEMIS